MVKDLNRKIITGFLAAAALLLFAGCLIQTNKKEDPSYPDPYTGELFAMDTVMTFTAYGEGRKEAVEAAKKEVQRLDALLSTGKKDSEISELNEHGEAVLSENVADLLARANEFYQKTGGIYDCTIYPVMELWGFPTQNYHVPTKTELVAALRLVDGSGVVLSGRERSESGSGSGEKASLLSGQKIDLGGIGKGFASDRLMEVFSRYKISSAIVSLGGNVQVLNKKPDGKPWKVGIRDPDDSHGAILGIVELVNQAAVTSGGYERYFEEDGKTYIHIIDPRTGQPVENDLSSVTILSSDGTLADALSTSLYIMGLEEAVAYWRASEDPFEAIFVKKDGSVAVTQGIADSFQTDRKVEILS